MPPKEPPKGYAKSDRTTPKGKYTTYYWHCLLCDVDVVANKSSVENHESRTRKHMHPPDLPPMPPPPPGFSTCVEFIMHNSHGAYKGKWQDLTEPTWQNRWKCWICHKTMPADLKRVKRHMDWRDRWGDHTHHYRAWKKVKVIEKWWLGFPASARVGDSTIKGRSAIKIQRMASAWVAPRHDLATKIQRVASAWVARLHNLATKIQRWARRNRFRRACGQIRVLENNFYYAFLAGGLEILKPYRNNVDDFAANPGCAGRKYDAILAGFRTDYPHHEFDQLSNRDGKWKTKEELQEIKRKKLLKK